MKRMVATPLGKIVQYAAKLKTGGGQALPGLVVEKLFPTYFADMLQQLPEGVVVITGTNGKTTTTKMVTELLEKSGKRVITNRTGSNLTRGIVSSLIGQANWFGKLPFDIAVFEIDEAYAKQFVKQVKPRWVLALNVSRDQLDRFGEVDAVAELISATMQSATEGVVTNANDPRLRVAAASLKTNVRYFGVAQDLKTFFPNDNELVSIEHSDSSLIDDTATLVPDVELTSFKKQTANYLVDGFTHEVDLQVTGQHNFQNAAAALTLVRALLPDASDKALITQLGQVGIAFGRGEIFTLKNGSSLQLVLVKNPASFRQTIASYLLNKPRVMFVINDNYADSRDVSWLWDVDFTDLRDTEVAYCSGSRAADMTLRLDYADISVVTTEPNIDTALAQFCTQPGDKVIVSTYTAMLYLYAQLTKQAGVIL